MTTKAPGTDVVRTTLAVLFIGILIAVSSWVLRPFLSALVWATMIVVTTWPLMLGVQKLLRDKRALAVTVMTAVLLLVFIIPFTIAIVAIIDRSDEIIAWSKSFGTLSVPPPPEWVEKLPLVGSKIAARWQRISMAGAAELNERLAPYAEKVASWLLAQVGSVMMMIVQFLLTVIISAVLFANGEKAAEGVCLFARRLGGRHGEDAAILAARAVRAVALGVVGTALIQSLLGGLGLVLSGVPAAALLTAVMFILCVAQIGPGLVLIPVVVWLFWKDQTLWGSIMIVWTIVAGTIDNIIRPFLIKRGADLPLLLIFAGVIGGLIAFGVIGLFIGPVMLAVTYTLLEAWVLRIELDDERAQQEERPVE
ncbi:AI-2E family transporter YdiK [Geobacter sp. SVR]|uniref:AI-2E family transporter YdiK n=1 Tax=Geobacter sp. SVR TaxID=2495594 RepID=UPI00143EF7AB|nr:AI-2E family transporter YdiK [Geobacter sp. SVR]BCS52908.1 membrane protein [Geobacter sp. SVR]GCF87530.1 membrane protein [Geobacter sp. SVR]